MGVTCSQVSSRSALDFRLAGMKIFFGLAALLLILPTGSGKYYLAKTRDEVSDVLHDAPNLDNDRNNDTPVVFFQDLELEGEDGDAGEYDAEPNYEAHQ